jgi:dGTPase
MSHENVWSSSKHQTFLRCGFSHLEGQAVRAADKISYLLSDLEDGIKLGSIKIQDILSCRLFYRAPIDFRLRQDESIYFKFIEQRGAIIKLLMEDIILESSRRIAKLKSKNDVYTANDYCIYHSPLTEIDMNEIWHKIQVNRLHKDPRVLSANMRASKMVSELTLLYTLFPEHIEEYFRIEHERLTTTSYISYYRNNFKKSFDIPKDILKFLPLDVMIGFDLDKRKGIDTYNLILAKDYVAGFTDKKVVKTHSSLLGNK